MNLPRVELDEGDLYMVDLTGTWDVMKNGDPPQACGWVSLESLQALFLEILPHILPDPRIDCSELFRGVSVCATRQLNELPQARPSAAADARLIAAAPDLLEALKGCVDALSEIADRANFQAEESPRVMRHWDKALEAIRKAEGGE